MLLYRILSYFLLVMGVLMGLSVLMTVPVALANPELLIDVFVLLAVVLYTFSSFVFLKKGISGCREFKNTFREFIIVNSFVSIIYIGRSLWKLVIAFPDQAEVKKLAKDLSDLQKSGSMLSETMLQSAIKATLFFSVFYVVVLAIHIVFTIILVKKYRNLFVKSSTGRDTL